jgi:hypothetical protein
MKNRQTQHAVCACFPLVERAPSGHWKRAAVSTTFALFFLQELLLRTFQKTSLQTAGTAKGL